MLTSCKALTTLIILLATAVMPAVAYTRSMNAEELATTGESLTALQAQKLELQVAANPDDIASRTRLLGYYFTKIFESGPSHKVRAKHILWLIQHHPDAPVLATEFVSMYRSEDPAAYAAVRSAWLSETNRYPSSKKVIGNAARFFLVEVEEYPAAKTFLAQVEALDPNNPEWPERLANILAMEPPWDSARHEAITRASREYDRALHLVSNPGKRFWLLDDGAQAAFEAGRTDQAVRYANELLRQAHALGSAEWDYGTAIHDGNLILGRAAVRNGNIEKAKQYLLAAGRAPEISRSSPDGPLMTLAKDLLEKGQRNVVLRYFKLCSHFWKDPKLRIWAKDVRAGRMPDFGIASLFYVGQFSIRF